jgi:hypothetical protein
MRAMGETTKTGGCHCGLVRYEVKLDLDKPVITCNCSICQKAGAILSFVPAAAFTLQKGEDALTEYRFNTHQIQHLFCKTCGIESFARGARPDGTKMVAINVRCLDEVDLGTLTVQQVDGRSR